MILPQLAGQPVATAPGTPALAKVLHDLGYNTGQFGKNHLGDNVAGAADRARLPGVLGLPLSSRRDAAGQLPGRQQDTPPKQAVAPPCKATSITGIPDDPSAVDPANDDLPDAAAPGALVQVFRRHAGEPDVPGRGPVTLNVRGRWRRRFPPR